MILAKNQIHAYWIEPNVSQFSHNYPTISKTNQIIILQVHLEKYVVFVIVNTLLHLNLIPYIRPNPTLPNQLHNFYLVKNTTVLFPTHRTVTLCPWLSQIY